MPWPGGERPRSSFKRTREMTTKLTRPMRPRKGIHPSPAVLTAIPSRRKGQTAIKRYWNKKRERKLNKSRKELANKLDITTKYIEQECRKRYGFHADPMKPTWQNKIEALISMDTSLFLSNQPKNLDFHNLDDIELPAGANDLLGFGLKFCIQRPTPKLEFKDTLLGSRAV
jgi:hypothetical protein